MTLPVSDNFNRANNDSLGANWSEIESVGPSNIRILGNRCRVDTPFLASANWNIGVDDFPPDQSCQALLAANNIVLPDNQNSGLGIRLAPDGGTMRGYGFIRRTVAGVAHRTLIRRADIGGAVVLVDELGDFPILQLVGISMVGATLKGWLFTAGAWVLRLTAIDATYADGQPGFITPTTGTATYFMEWDDWRGDAGESMFVSPPTKNKRSRMGFIEPGRRRRRALMIP